MYMERIINLGMLKYLENLLKDYLIFEEEEFLLIFAQTKWL